MAFNSQNKDQLLIAGGSRLVGRTPLTLDSTDILDLTTLRISAGPQMNARRMCSKAVNIGNGQVMIEGGWTGLNRPQGLSPVNPELFDIQSQQFRAMSSPAPRADNTLTMLGSTPVSIGGRLDTSSATSTVAKFANSQWANAQSTIVEARWSHRTIELGGELVVIGGRNGSAALSSTEIFNNSSVFAGASLVTARSAHTATRLQNGQVLVTGGENTASIPLSATEILAANGASVPGSTTVIPAPGQGSGTGTVTPGTGTAIPVISTMTPNSGPVGTVVTLNGTGFSTTLTNNSAEIGGIPATVTNASATQLTIVVPNGATTGPVAVSVGGQAASGPVFTVTTGSGSTGTTGPRPDILFIVPNAAPAFVPVAITGRNFGTSPKAFFNGTPSINIISLKLITLPFIGTVHELVTLVPPGATSGDLEVEANGQRSAGVPFTVN
ncbi:MAG: IPT/TIG domain-containing protein [Planctomycetota bacterium]|nr:IPT/TIG domain-containing protein [Planctomycetota bacterium]